MTYTAKISCFCVLSFKSTGKCYDKDLFCGYFILLKSVRVNVAPSDNVPLYCLPLYAMPVSEESEMGALERVSAPMTITKEVCPNFFCPPYYPLMPYKLHPDGQGKRSAQQCSKQGYRSSMGNHRSLKSYSTST